MIPFEQALQRRTLLRRISTLLEAQHVLILAPGGYGKSMLLEQLASQRPATHMIALRELGRDLALLQQTLTPLLKNPRATLLIDDLHLLNDDPELLPWICSILTNLSSARLVLSARQLDLPLQPDDTLRRSVALLQRADLAFSAAESHAMGYPEAWYQRSSGWPLALALMEQIEAIGIQQPDAATEYLLDNLADAALPALPSELASFLHATAIPRRFNQALAAVCTGLDAAMVECRIADILRRGLFLERLDAGWFQYHDLIRAALLRQQSAEALQQGFLQATEWFAAQGDQEQEIEHAIEGRLDEHAAMALLRLPRSFIWAGNRQRTYRRWVLALPEAVRAAHPQLLAILAHSGLDIGWRNEARVWLDQATAYAEAAQNVQAHAYIALAEARAAFYAGDAAAAIQFCDQVLSSDPPVERLRRAALVLKGNANGYINRFSSARYLYEQALRLPDDDYTRPAPSIRYNLVIVILIPLGAYAAAQKLLEQDTSYYATRPLERAWILLAWASLYEAIGDWPALARTLDEIDQAEAQAEQADEDNFWSLWWRMLLQIGVGHYTAAAQLSEQTTPQAVDDERRIYLAIAQVWLARRQGQHQEACRIASATLDSISEIPLYQGILALEQALAALHTSEPVGLRPEIGYLVQLRSLSSMHRLRALLAIRCHRAADPNWKRHAQAALRQRQRYGYANILIRRDPDLGCAFWTICLIENLAVSEASAALIEIGDLPTITALLRSSNAAVRSRVATLLAAMAKEEAIPALMEALNTEQNKQAKTAISAALDQLEQLDAPPLEVRLMGQFQVLRAGQAISRSAWQRPAVERLFQYFALHQGQMLHRDQLLEDLWPDGDPETTRASFRTMLSWMRRAIEPYLRPKTPARYLTITGESYCFGKAAVHVDLLCFEQLMAKILAQPDNLSINDSLLQALEAWQPLLPELPYEPWTLEPRERSRDHYVAGCMLLGQHYLDRRQLVQAADWATRVIKVAAWHEEAYQLLMRAQARQGQPTTALKTYTTLQRALQRELDAPPSELSEWLAERLRRGEAI